MSARDMSAVSIDARLREVGRLSDLRTEARLLAKVEMSPRAIDARLRTVEQLRRLCLRLAEVGRRHRDNS